MHVLAQVQAYGSCRRATPRSAAVALSQRKPQCYRLLFEQQRHLLVRVHPLRPLGLDEQLPMALPVWAAEAAAEAGRLCLHGQKLAQPAMLPAGPAVAAAESE